MSSGGQESERLSKALHHIWPCLERSDEKERRDASASIGVKTSCSML